MDYTLHYVTLCDWKQTILTFSSIHQIYPGLLCINEDGNVILASGYSLVIWASHTPLRAWQLLCHPSTGSSTGDPCWQSPSACGSAPSRSTATPCSCPQQNLSMAWWTWLHSLVSQANCNHSTHWFVFPEVMSGLSTFHFICSMCDGPGYLPRGWKPNTEAGTWSGQLQWCASCKGYKAPRAHHCRTCHRCVMKMDHHCPWINNCVGHFNQGNFVVFMASSVAGCFHAIFTLAKSIYFGLYR